MGFVDKILVFIYSIFITKSNDWLLSRLWTEAEMSKEGFGIRARMDSYALCLRKILEAMAARVSIKALARLGAEGLLVSVSEEITAGAGISQRE